MYMYFSDLAGRVDDCQVVELFFLSSHHFATLPLVPPQNHVWSVRNDYQNFHTDDMSLFNW